MSYDYTAIRVLTNTAYWMCKDGLHHGTADHLLELQETLKITADPTMKEGDEWSTVKERQKVFFDQLQQILKLEQPGMWDIEYLRFEIERMLEGEYVNRKQIVDDEIAKIEKIIKDNQERDVSKELYITSGMYHQTSTGMIPVPPFYYGYKIIRYNDTYSKINEIFRSDLEEKEGYAQGQYIFWFSQVFYGMVMAQYQAYLEKKKEEIESGKQQPEDYSEESKTISDIPNWNLQQRYYMLQKFGVIESLKKNNSYSQERKQKVIASILKCSHRNGKKLLNNEKSMQLTSDDKIEVELFLNQSI